MDSGFALLTVPPGLQEKLARRIASSKIKVLGRCSMPVLGRHSLALTGRVRSRS